MLQDGNVRSYTTYQKINNYSCVSQYLIYINERISEISVMKHFIISSAVRESRKIRRSNESFPRQPIVNRLAIFARRALPRPATVNKLRSNSVPPLFAAAVRRGFQSRRNTVNFLAPKTGAENLLENFRDQVI